jgi:hypothetical protein
MATMVFMNVLIARVFMALMVTRVFMGAMALLAGRETLAAMVTSGVGGEDRGFHGPHCRLAAGT